MVGFINKCTVVSGVKTPLITGLSLGVGNETAGGGEGFVFRKVIASHLTGPILVKNPALLHWMLEGIYALHGQTLPDCPAYPYEENGYTITARELKNRISK